MKDIDTKALMGEAKFYEGYSRWDDDLGRYETWEEAVSRVMNMHRDFYKDKMSPELSLLIDEAESLYKLKYVLGAQRALQFGGDQILKHQMRMYNCFSQDTAFVTDQGMRNFTDFSDGDVVTVKTPYGNWKKATVKSYGSQRLYDITFKRNNHIHTVRATKNHRWILKDNSVTDNLNVGDALTLNANTFTDFEFDSAEPDEKLYWAYGYVFGDGTVNKTHSMVRLCGKDINYEYRFKELGFKTSSSMSLEGDVIAYTGKYKKTLPDPKKDAPRLIRAFVRGWLDADGEKAVSKFDYNRFTGIQSSNKEAIEFIREVFPIAGIYPISEIDKTGEITNYGKRPYTIRFRLGMVSDSKYAAPWRVETIKESNVETVWCLEVEDDRAFVIEQGIPTGNCTSSYADRAAFFGELFYVLLCGAGAGFSVQKHHIAKLPEIVQRKGQAKIHEVEDSIEGWSTALDVLMSSFFVGGGKYPEYAGRRVYFDLNKVRPRGAMISGGFKAPGPEPLRKALDKIEHLIQGAVLAGRTQLKPIEVYDICMHAADAVLSGGVRRSATICLFSPDDDEMINAKTGSWFIENPQRGRSNNSAVIVRDEADRDQFAKIMRSIKQFGEPGFVFTESTEHTYNPCVEIGKYPVWVEEDGTKISGWQGCNLSEGNGSKCTSKEEFLKVCRAGAILGTLQAGYTDFKFLDETSKKIFDREALIGVSLTGWMNAPDVLFNDDTLREGAELVKKVNKEVAALIGINPAARTTCVKPSGNASILLGTSSGIHGDHSPRYIRHVQMNKEQEVAKLIKESNPYMVEDSVWSTNGTDYQISFPVIAPKSSVFKRDLYGVKLLERVKQVQNNWVEYGTDEELCVDPTVRHNVSNTVQVAPDQWDEVEEFLFENRDSFAGISFLAASGDKDFNQAPFTEVLTEDQLVDKYGRAAVFASGLIVESFKGFGDLWTATFVAQQSEEERPVGEQNDRSAEWIRRFDKFAENYFDGDKKAAEYCLKDVHLLHKWTKIQQNMSYIDFENGLAQKSYTDIDTMGATACAGGACEI